MARSASSLERAQLAMSSGVSGTWCGGFCGCGREGRERVRRSVLSDCVGTVDDADGERVADRIRWGRVRGRWGSVEVVMGVLDMVSVVLV